MKIKIKVYPHSGKEEIERISENKYKIYLKKSAENNKANIELIKLLKKHFKKSGRIILGLKSREKIIEINDN